MDYSDDCSTVTVFNKRCICEAQKVRWSHMRILLNTLSVFNALARLNANGT